MTQSLAGNKHRQLRAHVPTFFTAGYTQMV